MCCVSGGRHRGPNRDCGFSSASHRDRGIAGHRGLSSASHPGHNIRCCNSPDRSNRKFGGRGLYLDLDRDPDRGSCSRNSSFAAEAGLRPERKPL